MDIIYKAKSFAKGVYAARGLAHGKSGPNYFDHPDAVARHVWQATLSDVATAAALLHDVLDDTRLSPDLLLSEFGYEVASLVLEVADTSTPRDGSRSYRAAVDRAHVANASPTGQTIKVADLMDSTVSLIAADPSKGRAELNTLKSYLEVLPKADPALLRNAWALVQIELAPLAA